MVMLVHLTTALSLIGLDDAARERLAAMKDHSDAQVRATIAAVLRSPGK